MKCFRAETDGVVDFLEFEGEYVRRQIVVYPEALILLEGDETSDAKLSDCDFPPGSEITPAEFEAAWRLYCEKPHQTRAIAMPDLRRLAQANGASDGT